GSDALQSIRYRGSVCIPHHLCRVIPEDGFLEISLLGDITDRASVCRRGGYQVKFPVAQRRSPDLELQVERNLMDGVLGDALCPAADNRLCVNGNFVKNLDSQ